MILARVIAWFLHAWRGTRYTEIDAYALYRAFPPKQVTRTSEVWVEVRDE